MNQLDNQQATNKQDYYGQTGITGQSAFDRAIAQKVLELPKPSMSAKLNRVAELFELDVLSEEEALKACKVIIGQHAKAQAHTDDNAKYLMPKGTMTGTKVADVAITSNSIVGCAMTHERLGIK